MADPLARLMPAGAPSGDGEPSADVVRRCDLIVTEGVPDFLTWATLRGDADEFAPAVIGIISGSWTEEIAARVPSATAVYLRPHADAVGDKYSAQIVKTLVARCLVSVRVAESGRAP